jgi:hypothetical protein
VVTDKQYEEMLKDPKQHFTKPDDVLSAQSLNNQQKLGILKAWQMDATELQVATEENMGGGEPDQLDEVMAALGRLRSPD